MSDADTNAPKLPLSLKIVAAYLLWIGVSPIVWLLTGIGPHFAEFTSRSAASKAGAYAREASFAVAFLLSGTGILYRKAWARKLALTILVLDIPYSATAFAWGFARGRPSSLLLIASHGVLAVWNAFWFYIIYRKHSSEVFQTKEAQPTDEPNGAPPRRLS